MRPEDYATLLLNLDGVSCPANKLSHYTCKENAINTHFVPTNMWTRDYAIHPSNQKCGVILSTKNSDDVSLVIDWVTLDYITPDGTHALIAEIERCVRHILTEFEIYSPTRFTLNLHEKTRERKPNIYNKLIIVQKPRETSPESHSTI